jgi:RimK-like ATP-grasp domain
MILLWGLSGDDALGEVMLSLRRHGASFAFLDQRDVAATEIEMEVCCGLTGVIRTPREAIDLGCVTAVYLRAYDSRRLPDVSQSGPESSLWSHALAVESALYSWVELTDALVVNRPTAMAGNNSKPYQAELIRRQGFKVPATLMTTDPEAVRNFCDEYGSVIYKSASSIRSIVSRLSPEHLTRLDDVRWCPTQFQQYIPGQEYRLHVVGDRLFSCRITSEADDYRYARRQGSSVEIEPCELPRQVGTRAKEMVAAMGLFVAGVDLRQTPDGHWYCFEVNPSPGFTYYEAEAAHPIADAIAQLLAP